MKQHKLTKEQKEILKSLTPLERKLIDALHWTTIADIDQDPFDFGEIVDKLASHYKKICRGRFDEWEEKLHSSGTLSIAVNTDERLSETHLKWRKEEYGQSYLKQIITAAIQLGIDQSHRLQHKRNKGFKNPLLEYLDAIEAERDLELAKYAKRRERERKRKYEETM